MREWFRWMLYAWKLGSWRIEADIAELRGEQIPPRPKRVT